MSKEKPARKGRNSDGAFYQTYRPPNCAMCTTTYHLPPYKTARTSSYEETDRLFWARGQTRHVHAKEIENLQKIIRDSRGQ